MKWQVGKDRNKRAMENISIDYRPVSANNDESIFSESNHGDLWIRKEKKCRGKSALWLLQVKLHYH